MKGWIVRINVIAYAALLAASCVGDKKEEYPRIYSDFSLSDSVFTITHHTLFSPYDLLIEGGSGNFTVISDNESVLTARYNKSGGEYGSVSISTKEPGVSSISIVDNITGHSDRAEVTVENSFFVFCLESGSRGRVFVNHPEADMAAAIEESVGERVFIQGGYYYALINDALCTLHMFRSKDDYFSGNIGVTGRYGFEYDDNIGIASFRLEYSDGDDSKNISLYVQDRSYSLALRKFFTGSPASTPLYGMKSPGPTIPLCIDLIDDYKVDYPGLTGCSIWYVVAFDAPRLISSGVPQY